MATIATGAETVQDVVAQVADNLLNGLLAERQFRTRQEALSNRAARRAIELFAEDLATVWCPDADTRLGELPVPTEYRPEE